MYRRSCRSTRRSRSRAPSPRWTLAGAMLAGQAFDFRASEWYDTSRAQKAAQRACMGVGFWRIGVKSALRVGI